jgi:DNA polymerase III gamma/tau subunit
MQVPSQVWVGSAQTLKKQAITYLQQQFCKMDGCNDCLVCRQVAAEQYYNILWLLPEGQYKVDQVREVLSRLSLMLSSGEQFYFVFQDAQCLNASGANSLLKSIEEPPAGYNFLFLTKRKELLLPTILSRSIIKSFTAVDDGFHNELFTIFTSNKLVNPIEFGLALDKQKGLTDRDNRELLDQIYSFWMQKYKITTDLNGRNEISSKINYLQSLLDIQPMSGSGKIFWKEVYFNLS